MLEEELDVWKFLQLVQQPFVETTSVNCSNELGMLVDDACTRLESMYPAMSVVELGLLDQLAVLLAMDHSTMHGNGLVQDGGQELWRISMSHRMDTSFGQGEIDGLGEVERYRRGISKIYDR
jgi:hypothetical protein